MPGAHRAMALEAGKAAHESFAAIRVSSLWHTDPDTAICHAARIFGTQRAAQLLSSMSYQSTIEENTRKIALETLATSGFYDDPYDRRRTVANIETLLLAYCGSYDHVRFPVWTAKGNNPERRVGIEIPFAIVTTFTTKSGRTKRMRYTGRIDGLHWNKDIVGEVLIHENKTGARLDDAWSRSFDTSHQVTGYTVAGSLFTGSNIARAVVRGTQLPLPRMLLDGLKDVWVTRTDYHKQRWIEWVWHTLTMQYWPHQNNPVDAPMYTHSCNRYFRPCSFIPFCYASTEDQHEILAEMEYDEWSPLHEGNDGD